MVQVSGSSVISSVNLLAIILLCVSIEALSLDIANFKKNLMLAFLNRLG